MSAAVVPSKATCWFCNRELPRNDMLEMYPFGRRVAYDAESQRYWVVCLKCGKWCLTTMEDDQRAETIDALERWWRGAKTRYSTGGIGLGEMTPTLSVVRVGESTWQEFAFWRHVSALRRRRRVEFAWWGVAGAVATAGLATGLLNYGGAAAIAYLVIGDARTIGLAKCRIPGYSTSRLVFRVRQLGNLELARGTSGRWSVNIQHLTGATQLHGAEGIRALSYLLPLFNQHGMTRRVVDDAMELVSAAGGPEALAERAAELVISGSRNSEEAVRLKRYKPSVRAALEIASQEHVERRRLGEELALLRNEWKYAEEIALQTGPN